MNIHLGCGPIKLPGFVNIDHEAHWQPDVCCDYLALGPEYDGAARVIYSCHSIEHLDYPLGAVAFFKMAHRVLAPGGVLRVVVPDLEKIAKKYVRGEDLRDIYGNGKWFYHYEDSSAERFHFFMTAWQHRIVFDGLLLARLMRDAGFQTVTRRPFGHSPTPLLCGIDRYESESLCMEAVR